MKKCYLIIIIITGLFVSSCNSKEDELNPVRDNTSQLKQGVTFSDISEGVSVLIFDKYGGSFIYVDKIDSGWDAQNKVTKNLALTDYKFIYYKKIGKKTLLDPAPVVNVTDFNAIKFKAAKDPAFNGDYVMPVDEIWLAEKESRADTIYKIRGEDKIKQRLTRAVSQIELHVKRGTWANGQLVDSIPFSAGQNILDNIQHITMKVTGVGEALSIKGGIGNKMMFHTFDNTLAEKTDSGFATFSGPFVFPSASGGNASLDFTILQSDGTQKTKTLAGRLERNKKLKVTLWLGESSRFIDITYEIDFISEPEPGDEGIWE